MALIAKRPFSECLLPLKAEDGAEVVTNHIFEPEFHQDTYRDACETAKNSGGAFQLTDVKVVARAPNRGVQPLYADDESQPETLIYQGMMRRDGTYVPEADTQNICALKSNAIRSGFIDFGVARSADYSFFRRNSRRAAVETHDVLINSTGDGTIGRVAVYSRKHKAIVDGHITIVRLKNKKLSWYVAAYLLSPQGQKQIYRYINGSSGQVEIYPQDIERLWIPGVDEESTDSIANKFSAAINKFNEFQCELAGVLKI